MTVYNLIAEHRNHNPHSHYFDYETLKFFGERRSEMRVLQGTATITDYNGVQHECYILSSYQHKRGCRHYAYFDTTTFEEIHAH